MSVVVEDRREVYYCADDNRKKTERRKLSFHLPDFTCDQVYEL